jgi:Ca2+-binding RTX toxin-like protein
VQVGAFNVLTYFLTLAADGGRGAQTPEEFERQAAKVIRAGNADDVICGGAGNDNLSGDNGADVVLGGFGDDVINGGNGDNTLTGGPGSDVLNGGNGANHEGMLSAARPSAR